MSAADPLAFDRRKFKELILYLAARCRNDRQFAAVKMAKALWLADLRMFTRHGKSITGADYFKLDFGPAPRQFLPVLNEMKAWGEAEEELQEIYGRASKKVVPKRDADMTQFSSDELIVIEEVIEYIRSKSAKELSDESHELVGWRLAEEQESIPYFTVLIPPDPLPPTEEDIAYAAQIAARIAH